MLISRVQCSGGDSMTGCETQWIFGIFLRIDRKCLLSYNDRARRDLSNLILPSYCVGEEQ